MLEAIKCKHCNEWLSGKENESSLNLFGGLADKAKAVHRAILGSNDSIIPTDENPLIIDDDLSIFGDFFTYKGDAFYFDGITHLWLDGFTSEVNLLKHSVDFNLCIGHEKYKFLIKSEGRSMYVTGKKNKRLKNAFQYLNKMTQFSILQKYINDLNEHGKVQFYEGYWLDIDGYLHHKDKTINLRIAKSSGFYKQGDKPLSASSINGYSDPFNWVFSEEKGWLSKKIKFRAIINHDAIRVLFKTVVNGDSHP